MPRFFIFLAVLLSLALGSLLQAPDAHASEYGGNAHAADHIAEHGSAHFDSDQPVDHDDEAPHAAVHHHNCSFNLPSGDYAVRIASVYSETVGHALADAPLGSRAASVPTQPPKSF
ncbi:MAG: hypothetical protein WA906_07105 [Pacificimonas sp.]